MSQKGYTREDMQCPEMAREYKQDHAPLAEALKEDLVPWWLLWLSLSSHAVRDREKIFGTIVMCLGTN